MKNPIEPKPAPLKDTTKEDLRELTDQIKKLQALITQWHQASQQTHPDGRIAPDDEGALHFVISNNPQELFIRIQFLHPLNFLALSPKEARELAQSLLDNANKLDPLSATPRQP